jgi:hypothetical protein
MSSEVPTQPRSFRLSEEDRAGLAQLQKLLRRSQTDVISMALIHLRATLARDERVHLTVPDEEDSSPEPGDPREH